MEEYARAIVEDTLGKNNATIQLKMVDFYALLYTVRFMGTIGQQLNGNQSVQTDPGIAPLLETIAHSLM